jgi:hypothetical protein
MFVNDKRRAIFIDIPAAESTYITQNLRKHYGFTHIPISQPDEIQGVADWESHEKFCFVRNPYHRFISGFKYLGKDANMATMNFATFLDENAPHTTRQMLHTFALQKSFITNKEGKCLVDHTLRLDHLETDFRWMLKRIGFTEEEIVHNTEWLGEVPVLEIDKYITSPGILQRLNGILDQDLRRFGDWRILGMWHLPYYTPKYWGRFLFVIYILLSVFVVIIYAVVMRITFLDIEQWIEGLGTFPGVVLEYWQFVLDKISSNNPWFEEGVLYVDS